MADNNTSPFAGVSLLLLLVLEADGCAPTPVPTGLGGTPGLLVLGLCRLVASVIETRRLRRSLRWRRGVINAANEPLRETRGTITQSSSLGAVRMGAAWVSS
eukprot:scaffold50952_cov48-Phaeocystis_antarctica.AAC.1